MLWNIERFYETREFGCRRGGAAPDRRAVCEAGLMFCILHWQMFWMTVIHRFSPNAEPSLALTKMETTRLDRRLPDNDRPLPGQRMMSNHPMNIVQFGGYLVRASDPFGGGNEREHPRRHYHPLRRQDREELRVTS